MRLHANYVTLAEVKAAVPEGLHADITEHGSQSKARAFEVILRAPQGKGRRPSNFGSGERHGGEYTYAATWDEWGIFLARLYALDGGMICGGAKRPIYASADTFAWATCDRYGDGSEPVEGCMTHRWEFASVGHFTCKRCSAERRWMV